MTLVIYIGKGNIEFIIHKKCLLWQSMVGVVDVSLHIDALEKPEDLKRTLYPVEVYVCRRTKKSLS